jgi:hypothetical protein
MNKEQQKKGEKIASNVLRVLAVIGFVSILTLIVWVLILGARNTPQIQESLSAGVSALQGILRPAPEESLTFNIINRTIPVNTSAQIMWDYTGETMPDTFTFTYSCNTNVEMSAYINEMWIDITCEEPVITNEPTITILPTNYDSRFSDVAIRVEANNLTDTTMLSIINTDIIAGVENVKTEQVSTTTDQIEEEAEITQVEESTVPSEPQTTPTNSTPTNRQTVETTVPLYYGPADLVVEIKETGVLIDVDGEDTFFPVSPIPSDKLAAVVFTVTNKGGKTSDDWEFEAELPIEGDSRYDYDSPRQDPLTSGMQVEYTLGFDELLEEEEGVIRITLLTNDQDDRSGNNEDSVRIKIDSK